MTPNPEKNQEVLHSWKDISLYTGRSVRTVQRWEQLFGFPVHRTSGTLKGSVMAFRPEIDSWLRGRALRPQAGGDSVRRDDPGDLQSLHLHPWLQTFQQESAVLRTRVLAFHSGTGRLAEAISRTRQLHDQLSRQRKRNAG